MVDLSQANAAIARMPALFRPRPRQGRSYKDNGRDFKGRKFYFHGVPAKHREGTYIEVLTEGSHLKGQAAFTGLGKRNWAFCCLPWGWTTAFNWR
ncbi:MAG: hypothetical protein M5U34_36140 [Chloroflexi bacterium]|nr:hypothetical protein [Chloroflexota bacterium]